MDRDRTNHLSTLVVWDNSRRIRVRNQTRGWGTREPKVRKLQSSFIYNLNPFGVTTWYIYSYYAHTQITLGPSCSPHTGTNLMWGRTSRRESVPCWPDISRHKTPLQQEFVAGLWNYSQTPQNNTPTPQSEGITWTNHVSSACNLLRVASQELTRQ